MPCFHDLKKILAKYLCNVTTFRTLILKRAIGSAAESTSKIPKTHSTENCSNSPRTFVNRAFIAIVRPVPILAAQLPIPSPTPINSPRLSEPHNFLPLPLLTLLAHLPSLSASRHDATFNHSLLPHHRMDPKAARRQRKIALRREKKQAAAAEKRVSLTLPSPALAFVLFFNLLNSLQLS